MAGTNGRCKFVVVDTSAHADKRRSKVVEWMRDADKVKVGESDNLLLRIEEEIEGV